MAYAIFFTQQHSPKDASYLSHLQAPSIDSDLIYKLSKGLGKEMHRINRYKNGIQLRLLTLSYQPGTEGFRFPWVD